MNKIKHLLRTLKRVLDKTFGTIIDEIYWRFRSKEWAEKYLSPESLNHPHRQFLIDKISKWAPFQSLLEIGCASGPNLYLLAKKYPKTNFYGTEINKGAVKIGNERFSKDGLNN